MKIKEEQNQPVLIIKIDDYIKLRGYGSFGLDAIALFEYLQYKTYVEDSENPISHGLSKKDHDAALHLLKSFDMVSEENGAIKINRTKNGLV